VFLLNWQGLPIDVHFYWWQYCIYEINSHDDNGDGDADDADAAADDDDRI
jgi:hypothetical protein